MKELYLRKTSMRRGLKLDIAIVTELTRIKERKDWHTLAYFLNFIIYGMKHEKTTNEVSPKINGLV